VLIEKLHGTTNNVDTNREPYDRRKKGA